MVNHDFVDPPRSEWLARALDPQETVLFINTDTAGVTAREARELVCC